MSEPTEPKGQSGPTGIIISDPDVELTLEPTDPDEDGSKRAKLTVRWQGTSLQETTNQLTLKLKSQELMEFFASGTSGGATNAKIGPDDIEFSPGVATRPDAVTAGLQGEAVPIDINDGRFFWKWQGLNVAFHRRNMDDDDNEIVPGGGPIRALEFSKANYLNGLEYTEEWRATWQRAIALAWSDPHDDAKSGRKSLKSQLLADPFVFFKEHCNYALPPTVNLVVVDAEKVMPSAQPWGFVPDGDSPYWKWVLPRCVLIMFLPPAPRDKTGKPDPNSYAVALAAYEAVGKSYPFTVTS